MPMERHDSAQRSGLSGAALFLPFCFAGQALTGPMMLKRANESGVCRGSGFAGEGGGPSGAASAIIWNCGDGVFCYWMHSQLFETGGAGRAPLFARSLWPLHVWLSFE
ncbi:hypothetical protein VaNZ11_016537 [Volvox africanus]|uniref:Secreted protein n=1 Tax=Volvox africanus TaxID=51714 RepID=A0ABQ5SP29_9CHLO|nr:hypothetical protein VaNZ11_016537 [Volvox africanus]